MNSWRLALPKKPLPRSSDSARTQASPSTTRSRCSSFVRESNDDSVLGRCINNSVGRIATQLKMPFLHHSEFQGSPVLIGETEFVHPKNNKEDLHHHF